MPKLQISEPGDYVVPDGIYSPASYSGLSQLTTLQAEHRYGARFSGDGVLRFNDGQRVSFFDIVFESLQRVWVSGGQYRFAGCLFRYQGVEGMMGGACDPLEVDDCLVECNGYGPVYPQDSHRGDPSADHGIYYGYATQHGRLRHSVIRDTTGAGIKTNGNDSGGFCRDLLCEDFEVWRCGSEGTGQMQLDCTRGAVFRNGLFVAGKRSVATTASNANRNQFTPGFVTMWGDGQPTGRGCDDITFERVTVWNQGATFNIRLGGGTQGVLFKQSILVLADAPLTERASGQNYVEPRFEDCILFGSGLSANDSRFVRCDVRPAAQAASYFSPGNDCFLPADPASPYGWRPPPRRSGPMPPDVEPPDPPAMKTCPTCNGTGQVPA